METVNDLQKDSRPSIDTEKHATSTDVSSSTEENAILDKIVWRKLDIWILPVLSMFYLLSFLVSGQIR